MVETEIYLLFQSLEMLKKMVIQWAPKTVIKTPLHIQVDDLIKDIDEYLNSLPRDKS